MGTTEPTTTTQYPVPSDQRRGTMNHVATTRSTSVTVGTRTNYTRYASGRANTNTNTNTTTMKYNNNNTNNNNTTRIAKNATALAAGVTVLGTTLVAQNAHAASEVFQWLTTCLTLRCLVPLSSLLLQEYLQPSWDQNSTSKSHRRNKGSKRTVT